ncbi:MAG TPA: phosphatidylglycerophosphatase A [Candidatus Binatia bacterium]|jgi:phosphatidylglycerophosphatase A|nr:phosphatidylglycerophosphatase A [Candidatus Binatia bacterium]
MRTLILFLATGAYSGYAPVASGTVGSLVALPLIFLSLQLWHLSPVLQVIVLVLAIISACWVAGAAEQYLGEHDSGKIVVDEIVGFLTATALLELTFRRLIIAFFLFRLFDILKPPPARYFDQRVPGGAGVVLDDVCAGIYANLIVRVLL